MKIVPLARNRFYIITLTFIIALLVILIARPDLLTYKIPGSFEYIRKGEDLMDKGKYAEAIRYYEEAYRSSPESDDIKKNLVYAYSRCAIKMAESEKYDQGIEYLSRAYSIIENSYTRQNLSLMYAKKAVAAARKSDWPGAQKDLRSAREIVGDSAVCGRSLGITLFNDAVTEFKALREDSAMLLLKEAALVYGDSRIYEFLGDIYYKRTELKDALFYFDKASGLDPGNKVLAEKREKVIKEDAVSDDEKTRSSPYFEIRYGKGLPVNVDLVAKMLERAYFDVGRDLAYFPGKKTTVFFYSEGDFKEIFKTSDLVRAFYDGNIRIPLPGSVTNETELAGYLYHEYAHAITSAKTNNNCPVWLSEGISVYEEIKWIRSSDRVIDISRNIGPEPDISIQALDNAFKDPGITPQKLISSYFLAYTAVEYMTDNWGLKGLNGVLKAIADGRHAVNAIDDEYLLSEKEFNRRWADFVAKKYVKQGEAK